MIARVKDGLPLAASVQEDEQTGKEFLEYHCQAKRFFLSLKAGFPNESFIETKNDKFLFYFMIEKESCFLILWPIKNSAKGLQTAYLNDIALEFHNQYGKKVNEVTRLYSFIGFDNNIKKAKKTYNLQEQVDSFVHGGTLINEIASKKLEF